MLFLAGKGGRLLLTVFLISTLAFLLLRVLPGDPALVIAGVDADPQDITAIRERLGTDRPVPLQYLHWIASVFRLDFGTSFVSGRPVTELVLERLPLTMTLAVTGIVMSLVIAVPLGVLAAVRRWSAWDYFGMILSQAGMAIPEFWLGILLLLLLSVRFRVFPLFGADTPVHLLLPAFALGFARAAVLLRLVRSSMLEELSREYVLTARAKGLSESRVRYVHALRNALLPVITITGIQFGYLLGGAVVVEQVFSLPGLGRLFLTAIYRRDFPLIQGGVVFAAIIFSMINLAADILYGIANPRIRRG